MAILTLIFGIFIGCLLNVIINRISLRINGYKNIKNEQTKFLVIFICGLFFIISYLKFGLNIILIKALLLDCILIIVSTIDVRHQIIPNNIVIVILIIACLLMFIHDISFVNAIIGMLVGGGILFLLALIPGTIGGGDIKLMFALGLFLGPQKVIVALFLAFILAAIISILLLIFKIKGRKDHIPLGPFLAVGCFVAFHFSHIIF